VLCLIVVVILVLLNTTAIRILSEKVKDVASKLK